MVIRILRMIQKLLKKMLHTFSACRVAKSGRVTRAYDEGVRRQARLAALLRGGRAEKGRFRWEGMAGGKRWSWGNGKAGKGGEPVDRQVAGGWRAECGRLARCRPGGGAHRRWQAALVRQSLQWARQWGETLGSARESRGRPFLSRVGVPFPTNHNLHHATPCHHYPSVSYLPEPSSLSTPHRFVVKFCTLLRLFVKRAPACTHDFW